MGTTYESVTDLADALVRAAHAHGEHEELTGEADLNGLPGTRCTWFVSAPARSFRHEAEAIGLGFAPSLNHRRASSVV